MRTRRQKWRQKKLLCIQEISLGIANAGNGIVPINNKALGDGVRYVMVMAIGYWHKHDFQSMPIQLLQLCSINISDYLQLQISPFLSLFCAADPSLYSLLIHFVCWSHRCNGQKNSRIRSMLCYRSYSVYWAGQLGPSTSTRAPSGKVVIFPYSCLRHEWPKARDLLCQIIWFRILWAAWRCVYDVTI